MIKIHSLSYGPALRQALARSTSSIYLSIYVTSFNFKKQNDLVNILYVILKRKLASGLDIRFIIDHPRKHKTNYHATQFLIRRLKSWKFPFYIAPVRTTCHAKIILIDQVRFFVGSHNLTKASLRSPLEMSLEVSDDIICQDILRWFTSKFNSPEFMYFPPGNYDASNIYP